MKKVSKMIEDPIIGITITRGIIIFFYTFIWIAGGNFPPILMIICLILLALYDIIYLEGKKNDKSSSEKMDDNVLYLIDGNLDKKFTLMDLILPKYDAFDKPQEVCDKILKMDKSKMINLILTTNGGDLPNCEKILKALKKHKPGYRVYVRNECYSGGTLIALGANEIVMNDRSYLAKVDPQMQMGSSKGYTPIMVYLKINLSENKRELEKKHFMKLKIAEQYANYLEELFNLILKEKNEKFKREIMQKFIYSDLPHCKLFDKEECKKIGLNIRDPHDEENKYFAEIDKLPKSK